MTLHDFVMKRLDELGLKKADLVNKYDLEWSTLSKIKSGHSIRESTQQKLALALQCTQGEIQACLAESNPLKNVIIPKKALVKMKSAVPDQEVEAESADVFQEEENEDDTEQDLMFPAEETEEEMEDRVTREVAEEMYKRKLKDKVGKILASTKHELTDRVRQEIGAMLLQELWGEEN